MPQKNLAIVTGSAGWLGGGMARALAHGLSSASLSGIAPPAHLRCLVLPGEADADLKRLGEHVEVVSGDLRNPEDCKRLCADAQGALLYHCAGIVHPKRVADFFSINVEGTDNLLTEAVQAGVRRAVVVSSNSPIGTNPSPSHTFDESAPYAPYMGYGRSKKEMEERTRAIHAEGDLQTVIVRPPWFYGPHQPPRQTLFFEMIRDGKAPIVGGGENRRSMAYIENLCQGLILAGAVERAAGETYWIADERPYTMNEVIDTVERLLEEEFGIPCAHKRLRLPGLASEVAYVMDGTLQAMGLYHQKIHVLSEMNKTIACSIDKAKEELGYRPEIALEEGMRRSLAWCIDQGMLSSSTGREGTAA